MKTGEIPDAFTAQGLKEAREVLRVDSLSVEDRKIYKRYLEGLSLAMSLDDSSRYEGYYDGFGAGRAEGRAEGIEQGRADAMREMARTMKQHGDDINYIAAVIGLSPDEIKTLQ